MKRFWPALLLLIPVVVAIPFLPLRRVAWRIWTGGDPSYSREVVWFLSRQQSDGSWDEGPASLEGHALQRPGMTGLALLTLLGHGYSFLSKDEHEWYKTGPAIRSAFQCLVRDQRPDGTFRGSSGPMDHALATFALSESYGMTGSNTFKTPAEAATDALSKSILLGELGEDPALHAWAAMALWSAEASGIASDPRARDRILSFYDARTGEADAGEVMVRIGFAKKRSHPRSAPAIARIAARGPCPESEDYAAWYWGTHAIYQHEGGSGPAWSGWGQSVRTAVVRGQSSRGDWPGRTRGETFVRTCLAARTLQVYYGSPSVFPSR